MVLPNPHRDCCGFRFSFFSSFLFGVVARLLLTMGSNIAIVGITKCHVACVWLCLLDLPAPEKDSNSLGERWKEASASGGLLQYGTELSLHPTEGGRKWTICVYWSSQKALFTRPKRREEKKKA